MANVALEIFDSFSDKPAFKVPVFTSDFEFWIEVNEY